MSVYLFEDVGNDAVVVDVDGLVESGLDVASTPHDRDRLNVPVSSAQRLHERLVSGLDDGRELDGRIDAVVVVPSPSASRGGRVVVDIARTLGVLQVEPVVDACRQRCLVVAATTTRRLVGH